MDEDTLYENLPDDPGMAFVKLEGLFRQKFEQATRDIDSNNEYNFHLTTYLVEVIAAAEELQISGVNNYELPNDENDLWEFSKQVRREIGSLIVKIRISNGQNVRRYSVSLSLIEKQKARHFIDQIDRLVDEASCSEEKKEAIRKKLAELRQEIDQDRTRFDRFADKIRALARLSGDVEREGAEPWWKWVKALFGVVDEAKENEPKQTLPRPSGQKRVEPPRKQLSDFSKSNDLDDEVPF
jgi:hypothetical protein